MKLHLHKLPWIHESKLSKQSMYTFKFHLLDRRIKNVNIELTKSN